ncbi:MAG: ABC transporter ATP-binding protein [Anaerolineae bacterium]
MTQIRLENVTVRFDEIVALDSVDLLVRHGETMGVLGPSGCGKTTLLRSIAGLTKPDAGHIYFDGHDITDLQPGERGVGMVFESFALYPHMDSRDNIAFPLRVRHAEEVDIEARVDATVRRLGIQRRQLLERRPGTLAAGEQQQVALGRALIANPTVLLLDEPMGNLDAHTRAWTRAQLGQLMDELHTTAVYVTHDQQEAIALADRIAVMRAGRIVQAGTPGELRVRPANVFVAQFVGSPAMNVLAARVQGELLWIEGATAPLPLPLVRRHLRDGPILAGVRPEHLAVGETGPLPVRVNLVEPVLAHRTQLVYGELAGRPIVAEAPLQHAVRRGETLAFSVGPSDIHLFDCDDETSIS